MNCHSAEYHIQTLTPIWTGNVDGNVDRVRESGIIGGLRWWHEAMVRGLGGRACDPSLAKCVFNQDKYKKLRPDMPIQDRLREAGLCDVCQIFGATGWRRRFRLRVDEQIQPTWHREKPLNVRPPGRTRGWYLNAGVMGGVGLTFYGDKQSLEKIHQLLIFLENWGNLGARPQLGYGAFRIAETENRASQKTATSSTMPPYRENPVSRLHDLRSFVLYKIKFFAKNPGWWRNIPGLRELRGQRDNRVLLENLAEQGMVPVTPALKNHLRFEQKWSSNAIPHWLFGTLKHHERIRGKVAFSWAYRRNNPDEWEVRGWMSLPQDRLGTRCRNEVWRVFQRAFGEPRNWMTLLGVNAADYRSASLAFFADANPWKIQSSHDIENAFKNLLLETSA